METVLKPFAASILLIALVTGCSGDTSLPAPNNSPVTFIATNSLVAPVTIKVNGEPYVILNGGRSTQMTLAPNANVTWT